MADCQLPTGACCHEDGTCEVTEEIACTSPSVWHAEWADCSVAECPQPAVQRGDADCDGTVNVFDIDPFVMALTDLPAYTAQYGCAANADCNCDGAVNVFDIDAFVSCMIGECPDCP